jgi:uncharacterized protein (TIGR02246 family)
MKKVLSVTIAMAIFVMAGFAQTENDKKDIEKNVASMEEGWRQKDGKMYASAFAETHDFIVWNGYYFRDNTRAGCAAAHQQLFNSIFKTIDIKLKVDKVKYLRPDIALVHVLGAAYEKGKEPGKDPGVLMSLVMEKKAGKWEIVSFHNLDLEVFQDEAIKRNMPFPAEVMYANWYKK